jgi:hypothetical protein
MNSLLRRELASLRKFMRAWHVLLYSRFERLSFQLVSRRLAFASHVTTAVFAPADITSSFLSLAGWPHISSGEV